MNDLPHKPVFDGELQSHIEADDDDASLHGMFHLFRGEGGNIVALIDGVPLLQALARKLLKYRPQLTGTADIQIKVR